jgi:tRNA threonylcarbamoyladenosine biosynthesis protein TsaE
MREDTAAAAPGRDEIVVESASEAQTENAGAVLARALRDGDVVSLTGDLGAGKTVFARGVLRGLGVREIVQSPTFVVEREYRGRLIVRHLDLYRIEGAAALGEIGIPERFREGGVFVIEWGDRAQGLLPPDRIDVALEDAGERARTIRVSGPRRAALALRESESAS